MFLSALIIIKIVLSHSHTQKRQAVSDKFPHDRDIMRDANSDNSIKLMMFSKVDADEEKAGELSRKNAKVNLEVDFYYFSKQFCFAASLTLVSSCLLLSQKLFISSAKSLGAA